MLTQQSMVAKSCHFQLQIAVLSGKVSGTRAFIKLGRSYAVVRYNNESPQLNPHPHRQQKKKNLCAPLLLLSCSLPALYFLQTVAKMIVWKKTF